MPELPEVETIVRQLSPLVAGRQVLGLEILDSKLGRVEAGKLRGRTIESVRRAGKEVTFHLIPRDGGQRDLWLAIHLRMTGRLIWNGGQGGADPAHLRARLTLKGGVLLFVDPRRFGVLRLLPSPELAGPSGLDPFSPVFTAAHLARLLAGARQEIKPWFLRQDRLAGVGNIYASEILAAAGIHPCRPAGSLDRAEVRRLHLSVRRVLRRAVRHCGTTISDFQDARGRSGTFQRLLAVYGRQGQACRACRTPVERLVQGGRSTFFCPRCQVA